MSNNLARKIKRNNTDHKTGKPIMPSGSGVGMILSKPLDKVFYVDVVRDIIAVGDGETPMNELPPRLSKFTSVRALEEALELIDELVDPEAEPPWRAVLTDQKTFKIKTIPEFIEDIKGLISSAQIPPTAKTS